MSAFNENSLESEIHRMESWLSQFETENEKRLAEAKRAQDVMNTLSAKGIDDRKLVTITVDQHGRITSVDLARKSRDEATATLQSAILSASQRAQANLASAAAVAMRTGTIQDPAMQEALLSSYTERFGTPDETR